MKKAGFRVNRSQFCQIAGITTHEFQKLVAAGLPVVKVPAHRGEEYIVDTVAAFEWIIARPATEEESHEDAQTRLVSARADHVTEKAARLRASLLPADEVRDGWAMMQRHAKAGLERFADEAAKALVPLPRAHIGDPPRAERLLREEMTRRIDAALNDLAAADWLHAETQH